MAIEGFDQGCEGPTELIRLREIFAPGLWVLLAEHSAPVALHCGIVGGDQLRRHHPFQLVFWIEAGERRDGGRSCRSRVSGSLLLSESAWIA